MLKTDRLILRKWEDKDAESLFRYAKDPNVGPVAGWPVHKSVRDSLEIIRNVLSADETYAVCLKEDNCAIGSVGLISPDVSHTKIGENELEVLKIQPHGGVVLIAFKGVGTVEQAESLRGKTLYISRDDVSLPDGRYFIDDLIGCEVFDADSGEKYGVISDVSQTGANDVWHIKSGEKEYLLPAIDEVIVKVAPENERLEIRPLKGIFDNED